MSNLQFNSAASFLKSGNWYYKNGTFTNVYNSMNIIMDEIANITTINNGALKINSNGYAYLAWITGYGYLIPSGVVGYNAGNSGVNVYSIFVDGRIRWGEVDVQSSKHIKNILKTENELNYLEIKNEFIKLEFFEYNFKRNSNIVNIGYVAEHMKNNKIFNRFVHDNLCCDSCENINYRCKIKKINDNLFQIITWDI